MEELNKRGSNLRFEDYARLPASSKTNHHNNNLAKRKYAWPRQMTVF